VITLLIKMTKTQVLTKLNISQAEMARMFGVTRAAVSHWPDDEPLPEVWLMQLKYELHPELFKSNSSKQKGKAA